MVRKIPEKKMFSVLKKPLHKVLLEEGPLTGFQLSDLYKGLPYNVTREKMVSKVPITSFGKNNLILYFREGENPSRVLNRLRAPLIKTKKGLAYPGYARFAILNVIHDLAGKGRVTRDGVTNELVKRIKKNSLPRWEGDPNKFSLPRHKNSLEGKVSVFLATTIPRLKKQGFIELKGPEIIPKFSIQKPTKFKHKNIE